MQDARYRIQDTRKERFFVLEFDEPSQLSKFAYPHVGIGVRLCARLQSLLRMTAYFSAVLLISLFFIPALSLAATFNPTTVEELIEAIQESNTNGEDDDINLVPNMVYTIMVSDLPGGVPFSDGNGDNGLPIILSDGGFDLTINGNDGTIRRDPALFSNDPMDPCSGPGITFRIIQINFDADLTLNDVTIQNGCADSGGANGDFGGGIFNLSNLTLNTSTISNNKADDFGGGIINFDDLTLNSSTISNNTSNTFGGGIFNTDDLTIDTSTLSYNTADIGGGIFNNSDLNLVTHSTFTGNMSTSGGGAIFNNNDIILIEHSTFTGNMDDTIGGAIFNIDDIDKITHTTFEMNGAPLGGAIFNNNDLIEVTHSTFYMNDATDSGGAIFNNDDITLIKHSTFEMNDAGTSGGAIFNEEAQDIVAIDECTFSGNMSDINGGAIFNDLDATILAITKSTFYGNMSVDNGGAIFNNDGSDITMINSTLSGNMAGTDGGAILNGGDMEISFTTIANNTAGDEGGGIAEFGFVDIRNSIVAFNTAIDTDTDNCNLDIITGVNETNNYSENDECGFDFDNATINLGPLADNGGPTETLALISGGPLDGASAMCDAINNLTVPITEDQRGFDRPFPVGGTCDSGAYETQPVGLLVNGKPADRGFFFKNQRNRIKIVGNTPNKRAALIWGFKRGNGTFSTNNCGPMPVGIRPRSFLARFRANSMGMIDKNFFLPSSSENKALFQVIDLNACGAGPVFEVILKD